MKKTLSIILSFLMIISVLSSMPFTALADDTCIVVGSEAAIFGTTWDGSYTANTMESSGNGKYVKTYTVNEAYSKVQCKVVKNGSEWIGDKKGWNVRFRLTGAGTFTVVYDTNLNYVTVTGDIVELIILEEGFTYNVMPDGWTSETSGSGSWTIEQNYYPNHQDSSVPAHSGNYLAYMGHTTAENFTYLVSPTLDLSGMDSAKLNFWFINKAWSNDFDSVYLLFRIDGGDWNSVYAIESAHDNWTEVTVDLPTEALTSGVQIGFRMCDGYGYGVGIDDILLTAKPGAATAVTNYDLWVGGTQVTSANTSGVLGDSTVVFDAETSTLTLSNANLSGTDSASGLYGVINSKLSQLTISLDGENVINGENNNDGIDAAGGCNVTISGDGSLDINNSYYGTYIGSWDVDGGDLTVTDEAEVTVTNSSAAGIWVNHDIDFLEDCVVTVSRTGSSYNGIVSNVGGTITVDGGTVTVTNPNNAIHFGNTDDSAHAFNMASGNVTITSTDGYGIFCQPVGDTGAINATLTMDGGRLEINSASGATNIENVTIDKALSFTTGTDIDDANIVIEEAPAVTPIGGITISGIKIPVAGEAPDYSGITTTTLGVQLESVEWFVAGPGAVEVETFDYEQDYALVITFSIDEDNYTIPDTAQAVCNGPENSGLSYNCGYFGKSSLNDTLYVINAYYTTPQEVHFTSADDGFFDDFETDQGWTLKNGDCTNKWVWGEATNNGGSKALYVSNNGGTTNEYTMGNTAVYAAKAFSFDGGTYDFSFDWIGNGETNYDYARAVLVPANVVLKAGSELYSGLDSAHTPNGWIPIDGGSKLNLATEWRTQTSSEIEVPQGNYLVVFAWRNDASIINNPAIAIDNFRISGERKTITVNLDANGGTTGALWIDSFEIPADEFEVGSLLNPPAAMITAPEGYEFDGLEVNGVKVKVGETPVIADGTETVNVKFLWKAPAKNGWVTENGKQYYYKNDALVKNGLFKDEGNWYATDANGAMYKGWKEYGTGKRYFKSDGVMAIGVTKLTNGNFYYFNSSGIMQTGKVAFGSNWRFFKADGVMATGLTKVDGKWYYMGDNGFRLFGFQQTGSFTRYFDKDGVMATGLTKIDGAWYFFTDSQPRLGAMFKGWMKFGTNMRYFGTDGKMATGLTKATNGNWYYFNSNGIRLYGWVAFGKSYRYFDPSTGVMLADTTKKIDGKNYTFGANGICTNK